MTTRLDVPPVCVEFTVLCYDPATGRTETLVSDGFHCHDVETAARALERAAASLRQTPLSTNEDIFKKGR
jgi:hypothetical protein